MEKKPVWDSEAGVAELINEHKVDVLWDLDWEEITAGFKAECLRKLLVKITEVKDRIVAVKACLCHYRYYLIGLDHEQYVECWDGGCPFKDLCEQIIWDLEEICTFTISANCDVRLVPEHECVNRIFRTEQAQKLLARLSPEYCRNGRWVKEAKKAGKQEGKKEKMKFGYAVSSCFRKMFTFSGRARRAEYWFYFLFMNLVWLGFKAVKGLVINCFMPMASVEAQSCASVTNDIICWCATVALMIPMLAVTVRRLHDLGDTGWLSVAIYLLPWLVGVGFTIYTDNFTDLTLDVIGESIDGLIGLVGSYMAFYLFELAALIARVIMMARRGTVGANEYGADPVRYIG